MGPEIALPGAAPMPTPDPAEPFDAEWASGPWAIAAITLDGDLSVMASAGAGHPTLELLPGGLPTALRKAVLSRLEWENMLCDLIENRQTATEIARPRPMNPRLASVAVLALRYAISTATRTVRFAGGWHVVTDCEVAYGLAGGGPTVPTSEMSREEIEALQTGVVPR